MNRAVCQACNGARVRPRPRAALSSRLPGVLIETYQLEACDVCDANGSFPMPGSPIVGSLHGLLDGPGPEPP